jgi:hypothetical protein
MEMLPPNSNDVWDLANLLALAARELGAFMRAVSDLFGPEQSLLAAEEWLEELESSNVSFVSTPAAWRSITIGPTARSAARLNAHLTNTNVSAIPSSNCQPLLLLA